MSNTTDVYVNQLVINELSREKYLELSAAGQLQSNQLYLVDEDNLDAASGVISNVGTPISPTDAANKSYVDTVSSNIVSAFPEIPDNIVINNAGNNTSNLAIGSNTTIATYAGNSILIGNSAKGAGIAIGYDTSANTFSIAMGCHAQAAGESSIATGLCAQATSDNSIATGYRAQADGYYSIAIGCHAYASGCQAMAFGNNVSATSYASIATGRSAKATGYDSIATGHGAQATGGDSIATGSYAQATNYGSIATGYYAQATGYDSIAIGCRAIANNKDSLAIGANTQANGVGTIAIGSTYYCTFNPTIADANTPIVIGSGESAVSAAQIRVTKEGVMTVGGKEVGKSMLETWTGTIDSQTGETDLMIGAKQENGVYPRLHARNKDIHGVTGFSNESDKYTGQRYILDWDLAMSNDTSYLMGATKWTGSRKIGANCDAYTTTFVQPLIPVNTGTTNQVLPYALPCFENSPVYWNGHIIWNNSLCTNENCSYYGTYTDQAKDITIPWHNAGTSVSSIEFVVNNNKTDPVNVRHSLAIGYCAKANLCRSVAVGPFADATGYIAIAIGCGAQAKGYASIATGDNAQATRDSSIATGSGTKATGYASIAIGCCAYASGCQAMVFGNMVSATGSFSIATGSYTKAAGYGSIATGNGAQATGNASIATGSYAKTEGNASIATGCRAQATGNSSIATGCGALATSCHSIAIGTSVSATSIGSIATGYCAQAAGDSSIATGSYAQATGSDSIATGNGARAAGYRSIATGNYAYAKDDYTIAIGASKDYDYSVSASTAVPIIIGSDVSSVSAAQIKVTNTGIMSVGGNPLARKQFIIDDVKQSNNTTATTRMVKQYGDIWFAATKTGVYKSTDKAKTWTVTSRTAATASVFHVEKDTWLAGGFSSSEGNGIHITHDNGDTWTTINTTYCPWSFCRGKLVIDNIEYPNAIVASCTQRKGMIYSLDNGETWNDGAGWSDIDTGAFDVQYIKDGFVRNNTTYHWIMGGGYVDGNKGGIWYLDEATFTWIQEPIMATDNTNPNLLPRQHKVYAVAVYTTKTGKKRIYWNDSGDKAGTGGIYYIDENDTTCHKISGLTIYVYNFVENPADGYLYISAFGGGELLQISDDGNSFTKIATPTVTGVHGYAFDISEDNTYFVMGYDGQGFATVQCPNNIVYSDVICDIINTQVKQSDLDKKVTVRIWAD